MLARENRFGMAIAAGLVLALLGFVCGELRFLSLSGPLMLSGLLWKVLGLASLLGILLHCIIFRRRLSLQFFPYFGLGGFVLILLSDYMTRRFIYYPTHLARLDLLLLGLTGLGLFLLAARWRREQLMSLFFSPQLLFCVQTVIFFAFLNYTDGRLIWSDDQPSFFYRLHLLHHNFPWLPFYNVDWNAGYNAREFFPSGVLNVFALSYPFIPLIGNATNVGDARVFTILVGYLFILVCPWFSYFAALLFFKRREAATIAGLLSLAPTMSFFEWMLKYGTLGFATSTAMLPLTLALAWRVALSEEAPRWRHTLLLVICSTLTLMWSLSFLALVPISLWGLCAIRRVFNPLRRHFVLGFIALFLLINLPWIITFIRESRVVEFVAGSTLPGSHTRSFSYSPDGAHNLGQVGIDSPSAVVGFMSHLKHSHEQLKQLLVKINPLLILLSIASASLLFPLGQGRLLLFTILWLILVATIGEEFKPQLELRRLVTVSAFFMAVAVSPVLLWLFEQSLAKLFSASKVERWFQRGLITLMIGAIGLVPLTSVAAFTNQTEEKFTFAPQTLPSFVEAIKRDGGSGRVFFLGFILHELGAQNYASQDGGHVAPLVSFANKPMYASHFYHARWSEVDPIPAPYRRRGSEGIEEFLDLVNATSVVTFRQEWVEYCRSNSRYREVYSGGRFRLFARTPAPSGYFLRGAGDVSAEAPRRDGFYLRPASADLVLKYRYLPNLQVSHPELVELYPVPVFEEDQGGGRTQTVEFIGVRFEGERIEDAPWIHIGFFPQSRTPIPLNSGE